MSIHIPKHKYTNQDKEYFMEKGVEAIICEVNSDFADPLLEKYHSHRMDKFLESLENSKKD